MEDTDLNSLLGKKKKKAMSESAFTPSSLSDSTITGQEQRCVSESCRVYHQTLCFWNRLAWCSLVERGIDSRLCGNYDKSKRKKRWEYHIFRTTPDQGWMKSSVCQRHKTNSISLTRYEPGIDSCMLSGIKTV